MSGSVYLDTNVFIKGFEADDEEARLAWMILEAVAVGSVKAVTSELTIAEVLPKPLADNDDDLAAGYQASLSTGRALTVVPVSRRILIASAKIRARSAQIRLPDAIHLATALDEACLAFVSGDLRLRSTDKLPIIRLTSEGLFEIQRLTA